MDMDFLSFSCVTGRKSFIADPWRQPEMSLRISEDSEDLLAMASTLLEAFFAETPSNTYLAAFFHIHFMHLTMLSERT